VKLSGRGGGKGRRIAIRIGSGILAWVEKGLDPWSFGFDLMFEL